MGWVAAGLVLLFLMLRFPAFGGLVLAGLAVFCLYLYGENAREEQRAAEARTPERLALLEISDSRLLLDGVSGTVEGVVSNSSAQHVTGFAVRVRVYDCPASEYLTGKCSTIGEDDGGAYLDVPPKQKRAFKMYTYFDGLPTLPPDKTTWSMVLTSVSVK